MRAACADRATAAPSRACREAAYPYLTTIRRKANHILTMKRRVPGSLVMLAAAALFSFGLFAAGCSSTASEHPYHSGGDLPQGAAGQAPPSTAASQSLDEPDAPQISRSVGAEGGIVLLWPRVVGPRTGGAADADTSALAKRLQARLGELVQHAAPGRPVDVRPEPERVCPRSGCKAASIGVLLARARSGGCAAVALVSGSGPVAARLVPWIGQIDLSARMVPFRAPPESSVKVQDYVRCSNLLDDRSHDADVEAAIAGAK